MYILLHPMWAIKDLLNHSLISSSEHAGSVHVPTNTDRSKPANATALLRPAKLGRGLGSEPGQTVLYCTWGFKAKGSVPESSHPTHTRGSHQSSAITTIPAVASGVTGATANRALTALHIPDTKQNHLLAVSLIWALPLPFYFLDSCFSLIKYFFSDSLTASSIGHKESQSKGHVSLDQRQKLP